MNSVCIFTYSMQGGGAERVVLLLVNRFAELGIKVDLLLLYKIGDFLPAISDKVKVYAPPRYLVRLGLLGKALATGLFLLKLKPTHILTVGEWANLFGPGIARLLLNKTYIILNETNTETFINSPEKYNVNRFYSMLSRASYKKAHIWIAMSKVVADGLKKNIPDFHGAIEVVYNPIDDHIDSLANEKISHPWITIKDQPILLGVGRLHEQKDYPTMLKAMQIIRSSVSARLIILGEGRLKPALLSLRNRLGLSDCVDFAGFVPNPYPYYSAAKLLIHSARYEGFGNVFVEALACGLPIATTDCDTPRELFDDKEYVRITPVGDAESLANSALQLLKTDFNQVQIRKSVQSFNVRSIAERYLEVMKINSGSETTLS